MSGSRYPLGSPEFFLGSPEFFLAAPDFFLVVILFVRRVCIDKELPKGVSLRTKAAKGYIDKGQKMAGLVRGLGTSANNE